MEEPCRKNTCCFTGHRTLPQDMLVTIRQDLQDEIVRHIEQGYCWFAAGGALGFDTLAALTVLGLKDTYPEIALWLILPCKNQTDRWSLSARDTYDRILAYADRVDYICERYTSTCMKERNLRLVQESSSCICYLSKASGGTCFTVNQAQKCSLPIYNLAEK